MGTRSITHVRENENTPDLVTMYRHYDGYLREMGKDLKNFLAPITVVNGIRLGKYKGPIANGMSCLAAQLVTHFKSGAYREKPEYGGVGTDCALDDGIYLMPPDHMEEWEYTVWLKGNFYDHSENYHCELMISVRNHDDLLFRGPLVEFNPIELEKENATHTAAKR